ncbi:unnamed protein product, partial [Gulo gulo]
MRRVWIENTSLSYEYGDYDVVPNLPVDCVDGTCISAYPLRTTVFLLYAVVFLVGVPSNAMVAWVTWKEARRRVG